VTIFCVTVVLYKFNRICLELSRGASKCTRVCLCVRTCILSGGLFLHIKSTFNNGTVRNLACLNSAAHGVWPKFVKRLWIVT